jgi:transposase-like protein
MTNRRPPKKVGLTAAKVAAALELADGSPVHAARILGVTRNTINYWRERIETAELSQPPEKIPA